MNPDIVFTFSLAANRKNLRHVPYQKMLACRHCGGKIILARKAGSDWSDEAQWFHEIGWRSCGRSLRTQYRRESNGGPFAAEPYIIDELAL